MKQGMHYHMHISSFFNLGAGYRKNLGLGYNQSATRGTRIRARCWAHMEGANWLAEHGLDLICDDKLSMMDM
jgi:hypothetical protein